jgi:hypothetical protein
VLYDTYEEEDGDTRSMEGWGKDRRVFELPVQGTRVHSYELAVHLPLCDTHNR